jgi:hypothetical protein
MTSIFDLKRIESPQYSCHAPGCGLLFVPKRAKHSIAASN